MTTPRIVSLIKAHCTGQEGLTSLSDATGVSRTCLYTLREGKNIKYRKQTLDILYDHFDIERDDFYNSNMKKWYQPTFSVIGNILRSMRLRKGWSKEQVAKMIGGAVRELARIEAGDHLPSFKSWYMTELLRVYEPNEHDSETLRRGVVILKDLMEINRKYDPDMASETDEMKGHGKKTVVAL